MPIIALSAESDSNILSDMSDAGANDFISKPARIQDIINSLKRFGLYDSISS